MAGFADLSLFRYRLFSERAFSAYSKSPGQQAVLGTGAFFEEENQIVWAEWMPALDYFWCQETAAPIKKVLQIVAYYVRDDEAAMKDWTERHGLNLKDWGMLHCV